jgi:Amt family ammonium transporter
MLNELFLFLVFFVHFLLGKYNPSEGNIVYIMLGTGLLWFGWFGFNSGSALTAGSLAAQVAVNTHISASTAMITWVWLDYTLGKKPSASGACIASVIGLVGITPACGFVNIGAAMLIGSITVLGCRLAMHFLHDLADDRLEVFNCHGVGGMIGQILTGCFATTQVNELGADGAFYGNSSLLGKHIAVCILVAAYTFIITYFVFFVVEKCWGISVSLEQQRIGLDDFLHGETHCAPVQRADKAPLEPSSPHSVQRAANAPLEPSRSSADIVQMKVQRFFVE